MAQLQARLRFEGLLTELEDLACGGMIAFIDSKLAEIGVFVRRHPEALPGDISLESYLTSLDREVRNLWEKARGFRA